MIAVISGGINDGGKSGGLFLSLGSSKNQSRSTQTRDSARGSTLAAGQDITLLASGGAEQSDLSLQGAQVQAGRKLLLAPGGDIAIGAKTIDILEARETRQERVERKYKQSGLTISVSNPLITAVQTAQEMADAAKDTDDPRMKALAAANAALAARTAYDAVKAGQAVKDATAADKLGGIGINVSLGSSKSQSRSTQSADSARGSTLAAGQDITLVASGAGQDSDLTLQGAQVQAGRKLLLAA